MCNQLQECTRPTISTLQKMAYDDSVAHGLMEEYKLNNDDEKRRQQLCCRILEELVESFGAANDKIHFGEELADVIIMCMVTAENEGIDLGYEIPIKMARNIVRPYKHEGEAK